MYLEAKYLAKILLCMNILKLCLYITEYVQKHTFVCMRVCVIYHAIGMCVFRLHKVQLGDRDPHFGCISSRCMPKYFGIYYACNTDTSVYFGCISISVFW